MKKYLFPLLILLVVCSGCASRRTYGNHAAADPQANQALADDAQQVVIQIYPAASTQLSLKQLPQDEFGILLVEQLRKAGYAVREEKGLMDGPGVLRYIVDRFQDDNSLRVTLYVGTLAMSRSYNSGAGYAPLGEWTVQQPVTDSPSTAARKLRDVRDAIF
jgi:hypothetical protein